MAHPKRTMTTTTVGPWSRTILLGVAGFLCCVFGEVRADPPPVPWSATQKVGGVRCYDCPQLTGKQHSQLRTALKTQKAKPKRQPNSWLDTLAIQVDPVGLTGKELTAKKDGSDSSRENSTK